MDNFPLCKEYKNTFAVYIGCTFLSLQILFDVQYKLPAIHVKLRKDHTLCNVPIMNITVRNDFGL